MTTERKTVPQPESNNPQKSLKRTLARVVLVPMVATTTALGVESIINTPKASAQSPDDCVISVEVYRPNLDKQAILADRATFPISCSREETIRINSAEIGSIRKTSRLEFEDVLLFSTGIMVGLFISIIIEEAATKI